MDKKIIYNGRTFVLGTAKRYYFATIFGKNKSLHRYKYEQEVGPIPPGWHVHHKDKNYLNNETTNLEALPPKKHYAEHYAESADRMRSLQAIGREYAKAWHGSPEGLKWHNEHYDNVKDKLHSQVERPCSHCGNLTITTRKSSNTFCSNACKSAWRRANKPDMKQATCPTCGSEFQTLKYLPNTFCSQKCKPISNPKGFWSRKRV
jgi:endogenous inhibitor of DNA gyrase (YacG/DUF329 family)